jgi:outer membrane protein assembly factor BamE (lipoprotein component of BamABCDE complex)
MYFGFLRSHIVGLSSAALLMSACATAPRVGMSGSAVQQQLGAPALIMKTTEGARWFYPSGPLGTVTRAVNIDGNNAVTNVENVLVDEMIQTVTVGMSADEVLATIGPPHRRVRFDNLRATSWDYRYQDTWGYTVDLSIMIGDDNRVTGKVLQRIEQEDAAK